MTELSPAALAVRDAAEKETDLDFRFAPAIAAAALEAVADQVVPFEPAHKVGRFLEWHHLIRNSLQGSSGNRWCAAKVKVGFLFCGVTE